MNVYVADPRANHDCRLPSWTNHKLNDKRQKNKNLSKLQITSNKRVNMKKKKKRLPIHGGMKNAIDTLNEKSGSKADIQNWQRLAGSHKVILAHTRDYNLYITAPAEVLYRDHIADILIACSICRNQYQGTWQEQSQGQIRIQFIS